MPLMIDECTGCAQAWFPPRHWCPACGGNQWRSIQPQIARVAQSTTVRARVGIQPAQNLYMASVQLTEGPVVIAASETLLAPGTAVTLHIDGQHQIVAVRVG